MLSGRRIQKILYNSLTPLPISLRMFTMKSEGGKTMRVIRIFLKIIILPLLLLISILRILFLILINLSGYVIGPLMLFLFGCGIYTIVKKFWSQAFLLGLLEIACLFTLFAASFVIVTLENWIQSMKDFLRS